MPRWLCKVGAAVSDCLCLTLTVPVSFCLCLSLSPSPTVFVFCLCVLHRCHCLSLCFCLPLPLSLAVFVSLSLSLSVCSCLHLSLFLPLSLSVSLSRSVSVISAFVISVILSLCLYFSVFLSLSLCFCDFLSLPVSLSPSLTFCLCLSLCLPPCPSLSICHSTHCLPSSLSICLSLPLCPSVSPSLPVCLSLSARLSLPLCPSVSPSLPVCLSLSARLSLPLCLPVCLSLPPAWCLFVLRQPCAVTWCWNPLTSKLTAVVLVEITDPFLTPLSVPPYFVKKPANVFAHVNSDIMLECEAEGKPAPDITWYKNGDRLYPSDYFQLVAGSNLKILGLVNSDEGIYQCFAENSLGNVQASTQLIILLPGRSRLQRSRLRRWKLEVKVMGDRRWGSWARSQGHEREEAVLIGGGGGGVGSGSRCFDRCSEDRILSWQACWVWFQLCSVCVNAELRCSLSVVKTLGCYDCSQVDWIQKLFDKNEKKKKGVILLLLQKMSIVYIKTCFSWKILSVSSVADKKSEGHWEDGASFVVLIVVNVTAVRGVPCVGAGFWRNVHSLHLEITLQSPQCIANVGQWVLMGVLLTRGWGWGWGNRRGLCASFSPPPPPSPISPPPSSVSWSYSCPPPHPPTPCSTP